MKRHVRLGVLVPSSNTALEPLTQAIVGSIKDSDTTVSVHFARFAVTKIDLSSKARNQFEFAPIIAAAKLLADAQVDVIGWSGTSGGWLGFDHDRELCEQIYAETQIRATTSTLALLQALEGLKVVESGKKLGLVTPYTLEMNQAIIRSFAENASAIASMEYIIDQSCEQHLGITDNVEIGKVEEETIDRLVARVAQNGADVVITYCTNLYAAHRVEHWEKLHNIIVVDSVSVVIWSMLRTEKVNIDTTKIRGWGELFRTV